MRFSLANDPNDTAAQVRAKEQALAALATDDSPLRRWTRVADVWCSTGSLVPGFRRAAFGALSDAILTGRGVPAGYDDRPICSRGAEATATARRFFHWELEFPEVFFDEDGRRRPDAGFDAVVGNPPWDMVRADHRTAIATRRRAGDRSGGAIRA